MKLAAICAALCSLLIIYGCEDEEVYPETRLFRPVLNEDLRAEGNSIVINMGKLKKAITYTVEISRDTFKTTDYTLESDTNYLVVNDALLAGDPLFWNTLYQIRAVAHAETAEFDSKISNLGSVRTERFPTIMNLPSVYDVTDKEARVTWAVSGAAVTQIKVFAVTDLKLLTPLITADVPAPGQAAGEGFVAGLTPSTTVQIAIYSGAEVRGWTNYVTLPPDVDPTAAGVIDIRANESPTAVVDAVAGAAAGSLILVKRGVKYNMPSVALNKSITIQAAYGFGEKQAQLFTTGNWNIAGGSNFTHVRFIDLEIRGNDFGANYVFNPSVNVINVGEVLFEKCKIVKLRGIMRIRNTNVIIDNFKIINSQVDSIRDYGLFTADQDPAGTPSNTARVNNIVLQGSTFNHLQATITSRNNSTSITIEDCTFSNAMVTESTGPLINYRGSAGNNNVLNGISIKNSIFGPGWNQTGTATNNIRGKGGLPTTPFTVINNYVTNDWDFIAGTEIPGLRSNVYAGSQTVLWVDPKVTDNFNFKDQTFAGRFATGDPRWRVKL